MNTITGLKAKQLLEKGGKVVDVRSPVDFAKHSIPGSINLPLRNVSHLVKHVKKTEPVIFVGDHDTLSELKMAQQYASQLGFSETFWLESIESWNVGKAVPPKKSKSK